MGISETFFLLYPSPVIMTLTMRLLFLLLLVIVCIECGRNRDGKKNKDKKNRDGKIDNSEQMDDIPEEEEEQTYNFCMHKWSGVAMRLDPGTTVQFKQEDQCEVVQCLEGGRLEVSRVPVNPNTQE